MGELKGQNRFCTTVFVRAAWSEPVTAAAGGEVAQHRAAVVGAEEPLPRRLGLLEPARVAGRGPRGPRGLDRRLRLERLLVERVVVVRLAEAAATDRAELPVGGGLLRGDPLERLEPGVDEVAAREHNPGLD